MCSKISTAVRLGMFAFSAMDAAICDFVRGFAAILLLLLVPEVLRLARIKSPAPLPAREKTLFS
jgi:hypothetical protein